jgi:RNA polymerase-binding transcription factor DksA
VAIVQWLIILLVGLVLGVVISSRVRKMKRRELVAAAGEPRGISPIETDPVLEGSVSTTSSSALPVDVASLSGSVTLPVPVEENEEESSDEVDELVEEDLEVEVEEMQGDEVNESEMQSDVREFDSASVLEIEATLSEVEHALTRLHAGTYRLCQVCGTQIADADLIANPLLANCEAHPTLG